VEKKWKEMPRFKEYKFEQSHSPPCPGVLSPQEQVEWLNTEELPSAANFSWLRRYL
jgi:hypothetical protein